MNKDCDAKIQGLEARYPHDVSYCGEPQGHSGVHVARLRDGRDGWWFGSMRGFVLRSGELFEVGGGR
jgi:hypothetical protein